MKALFLAILLFDFSAHAVTVVDPNFIVHILGYVRKDYSEAVDATGKIKSVPEYQEQIDFVKAAIEASQSIAILQSDPAVGQGLSKLLGQVQKRDSIPAVAATCLDLQGRVMKVAKIETAPLHWPSRVSGKALFEKNCASCHGAGGHGDGPAGGNLDPKPSSFHDASRMGGATPFELFSTIKLGVPGTGMASFASLSDNEIWDLAFYAAGLRHEGQSADVALPAGISLQDVSSRSDDDLRKTLKESAIVALRLHAPPAEESATMLARAKLDEALSLLEAGNRSAAKHAAVMAYLEGVEPIEPRLRAKDYDLVLDIEQKMADVRAALEAGHSADGVRGRVVLAKSSLQRADEVLARKDGTAAFTFSVAAGIFLREAFEAVLIIITLLGVIRSIGSRKAALFVHGGWLLAVLSGVVAWFFSGWVMSISGAQRELLEGGIALFAVGVLLYFGFWLHRKTEIGKWRAFLSEMVKSAVDGKNLLALGAVSFMAVFREAFETVLFLRALLLESGQSQQWALAAGVLVSFVFVVIFAAALVRFSVRIPLRQLFAISSLVMVLLSFILIGKAVHSFQETGLLTITQTPIRLRLELIGFYPTYETMIAQCLVLALAIGFWLFGRRSSGLAQQTV